MTYTTAVFYFLTGTGNSYRAACWMSEACQQKGVLASAAPIQSAQPRAEIKPGSDTLLGLVTPTHGFTTPWLMLRFALRLPRGQGAHALVVPTRAGTKLGRIFFPGLEGTAGYLLALILLLKGYNIRGIMALDMPSNWTAFHPGFSRPAAEAIIARASEKMAGFMKAVLLSKRYLGGIISLILGLALVPVSCGYLFIGRFFLSKLFFASNKCNGCVVCAQSCPAMAIKMWGKSTPRPYWTFSCESCMRCMNYCPVYAVEASHPLAVILYFITTFPAALLLLNWLGGQLAGLAGLDGTLLSLLLNYGYILLSIGLTYLVFYLLNRIPVVNHFFTVATLTHYYQRYHAPGASLKDIQR